MAKRTKAPALAFDPNAFALTLVDEHRAERVVLPRPASGLGDSDIVVSPDGTLAALHLSSGQSEEGWELFSLTPKLRHLASVPHFFGMSEGVFFSPDSKHVVCAAMGEMVYTGGDGTTYNDAEMDEELRASATWVLEYAQLHVQDIENGNVRRVPICVRLPKGYRDEPLDWEPPSEVRFKADGALSLLAGWGKRVKIRMPPRSRILFARV